MLACSFLRSQEQAAYSPIEPQHSRGNQGGTKPTFTAYTYRYLHKGCSKLFKASTASKRSCLLTGFFCNQVPLIETFLSCSSVSNLNSANSFVPVIPYRRYWSKCKIVTNANNSLFFYSSAGNSLGSFRRRSDSILLLQTESVLSTGLHTRFVSASRAFECDFSKRLLTNLPMKPPNILVFGEKAAEWKSHIERVIDTDLYLVYETSLAELQSPIWVENCRLLWCDVAGALSEWPSALRLNVQRYLVAGGSVVLSGTDQVPLDSFNEQTLDGQALVFADHDADRVSSLSEGPNADVNHKQDYIAEIAANRVNHDFVSEQSNSHPRTDDTVVRQDLCSGGSLYSHYIQDDIDIDFIEYKLRVAFQKLGIHCAEDENSSSDDNCCLGKNVADCQFGAPVPNTELLGRKPRTISGCSVASSTSSKRNFHLQPTEGYLISDKRPDSFFNGSALLNEEYKLVPACSSSPSTDNQISYRRDDVNHNRNSSSISNSESCVSLPIEQAGKQGFLTDRSLSGTINASKASSENLQTASTSAGLSVGIISKDSGSKAALEATNVSTPTVEGSLTSATETVSFHVTPVFIGRPDQQKFNTDDYFQHLRTFEFGRTLFYTEIVNSTMRSIRPIDSVHGAVAVASRQLRAVARGRNSWISPPGCAMHTLVLHIGANERIATRLPFMQHVAALSVVRAIRTVHPSLEVVIKWPNDIYFRREAKLGGILTTCTTSTVVGSSNGASGLVGGTAVRCYIGCGVNIANARPLTCVHQLARSDELSVERFIATQLTELERLLESYERDPERVLEEYHAHWLHTGEQVSIEAIGGARAVVRCVDEFGFLIAERLSDGRPLRLQPDGNSFDLMRGLITTKDPSDSSLVSCSTGNRVSPRVSVAFQPRSLLNR